MARPPTGERKYQIEHMWEIHHEIVRLLICGMKPKDIAAQLNVSEGMVSLTQNSAIVRRKLDVMRATRDIDAISISQRIKELAPKAVDVLSELLDSKVEMMQYRASIDILDRAGHGAIKKEMSLVGHLTPDDIKEIKDRAKEIGLCKTYELEPVTT